MTREDLKDDLSRLLLSELTETAALALERGPMTEAKLTSLCSRPARQAAERVVQELERRARVDKGTA